MYERACVCVGVCESVKPIRGSALSCSGGDGNNLYVQKPLRRLHAFPATSVILAFKQLLQEAMGSGLLVLDSLSLLLPPPVHECRVITRDGEDIYL